MAGPRGSKADAVGDANQTPHTKLKSKHPIILDGGLSRELIRLKAPFQQPEWSAQALIEAPDLVRQAHANFAAAGADILTTNSFALVPFHIGQERFEHGGRRLAALAGRVARESADEESKAAGREVLVAGSLPPIFGSYEPDKFDASRVQDYLSVLVEGLSPYVNVWLGETLSLVAEAEAVQEAVRGTGKPFWISFTLDDAAESPCLRSGESVKDAARWAIDSGAEALLFNCSQPETMLVAIETAKAECAGRSSTIPLIGAYANAFVPESGGEAANEGMHDTRDDLSGAAYEQFARKWLESGASIIGGCCGIGPDIIRHLAKSIDCV